MDHQIRELAMFLNKDPFLVESDSGSEYKRLKKFHNDAIDR